MLTSNECIKGSSLIYINRLKKIFKCSCSQFRCHFLTCYFFTFFSSDFQMKHDAIFSINLLKMPNLSTDIYSFDIIFTFFSKFPAPTPKWSKLRFKPGINKFTRSDFANFSKKILCSRFKKYPFSVILFPSYSKFVKLLYA